MDIKTADFVSRQNIEKYKRLLGTELSDLERRYVLERLQQEQDFIASLSHPARPSGGAMFTGLFLPFVESASIALASISLVGPSLGL